MPVCIGSAHGGWAAWTPGPRAEPVTVERETHSTRRPRHVPTHRRHNRAQGRGHPPGGCAGRLESQLGPVRWRGRSEAECWAESLMPPAAVPHQSRALGTRASGVAGLLGPCPLGWTSLCLEQQQWPHHLSRVTTLFKAPGVFFFN